MRALLLPVLLAPLVLVSGCSPVYSGWMGVTVVEGEIVMLARTCDTGVDTTLLTEAAGSSFGVSDGKRLHEVGTDVDEDALASFPTGVMVDDLADGVGYAVSSVSKDPGIPGTYLDSITFARADLRRLEPGQVLARVRFASGDNVVDKATFATECD